MEVVKRLGAKHVARVNTLMKLARHGKRDESPTRITGSTEGVSTKVHDSFSKAEVKRGSPWAEQRNVRHEDESESCDRVTTVNCITDAKAEGFVVSTHGGPSGRQREKPFPN